VASEHATSAQAVVTSMIMEGLFERYRDLKVVLIECGFGWLPALGWRLDKHWSRLRQEVPHLARAPSEYIREHFYVTTQPMEETEDPSHAVDAMRWIGIERILLASDYPHWDIDDPVMAIPRRSTARDALRGDGLGAAAADVCAGRLQRDHRDVAHAERLRQDQAARSPDKKIHLHRVRPARMRPVGRPRRAHRLGRLRSAGQGLLDHLGFAHAHIMGGCPVAAFAVAHPAAILSMILFWPDIGSTPTSASPNTSPSCRRMAWRPSSRWSPRTASRSAPTRAAAPGCLGHPPRPRLCRELRHVERYKLIVAAMARTLFDRDTAPSAEPEDLLRLDIPALIIPGRDPSHATSAARYLEECLPRAEYWDAPVAGQTEESVPARILEFLDRVAA
jgi:hypothetical protein